MCHSGQCLIHMISVSIHRVAKPMYVSLEVCLGKDCNVSCKNVSTGSLSVYRLSRPIRRRLGGMLYIRLLIQYIILCQRPEMDFPRRARIPT